MNKVFEKILESLQEEMELKCLLNFTNGSQIKCRERSEEIMNKRKIMYFLKQKLCGLVLVASGVAIPMILDGDATASIFLIPLGLYIIFTREHLMEF